MNSFFLILNFTPLQSKVIPRELGFLKYLHELDISHNRLNALPEEMCTQAYSLVILNASNNKLDSLPMDIGRMKVMEDLNIADNEIELMPKEITDLKYLKVGVLTSWRRTVESERRKWNSLREP